MGCCESSEVIVNHRRQPSPSLFYIVDVDNEEDECCICFEKMKKACTFLPCTHKLHNDCAVKWFQLYRKDECPICRINIYKPWEELLQIKDEKDSEDDGGDSDGGDSDGETGEDSEEITTYRRQAWG